jgi:DNA-binding transcriptional LysR family regulator
MLVAVRAVRGWATLALRRAGEKADEQVRVRAAVSSPDFFACKEAAVAGAGIVLAPALITQKDVEARRLVQVLKEYGSAAGTVYLVHHGARFLQPKVRVFRDYVLDALGVRGRRAP